MKLQPWAAQMWFKYSWTEEQSLIRKMNSEILHYIRLQGMTIKILLELGAEPDEANGDGKTPLDEARFRGHRDVIFLDKNVDEEEDDDD